MKIIQTEIPEVLVIEPKVYSDARGFFFEAYQQARYQQAGIQAEFIQDNQSGSSRGVLRGIHYQLKHLRGNWCASPKVMFTMLPSTCAGASRPMANMLPRS